MRYLYTIVRVTGLRSVCLLLAVMMLGCSESGPERYKLSGSVTYGGKPVPAGNITFDPDSSQGNSGPGSVVEIKDGRYSSEPDQGILGGAYVVVVNGYDGVSIESGEGGMQPMGQPMFPAFETRSDFPKSDSTHDFEVPAPSR